LDTSIVGIDDFIVVIRYNSYANNKLLYISQSVQITKTIYSECDEKNKIKIYVSLNEEASQWSIQYGGLFIIEK